MSIFLIIIGAILLFICGILFLASYTVLKNQANWDDFYKQIEEKNLSVPEEAVYNLTRRMNFLFSLGVVIGLILITGGIILQIAFK